MGNVILHYERKKNKMSPVGATVELRSDIALFWALNLSFFGIVQNHWLHRASSAVAWLDTQTALLQSWELVFVRS